MRRIWLDDEAVERRIYTDHDLVYIGKIFHFHGARKKKLQAESNKITIPRDASVLITCPMELRHYPLTVHLVDGELITSCGACEKSGIKWERIVHRIKWKLADIEGNLGTVQI